MAQKIIKQTDEVSVTIDTFKNTYTIRLSGYTGATFIIDLSGHLTIGQSSRMTYDWNTWLLLQNEIIAGRQYMAGIKLAGGFPMEVAKQDTIKPKDYKPNCIYRDIKGRIILYLGKGHFLESDDTRGYNRVDCHYGYAILPNNPDVLKYMRYDGFCAVFPPTHINFDHYTGKPAKLVEEIKQLPQTINKWCIEGDNYPYIFIRGDA